jgi:peptide/nickel transport system substrate-binding protein
MPDAGDGDRSHTLVVAQFATPATLDPAMFSTGLETPLIEATYEQLLAIDPASREGRVVGELAESWTLSPDGRTIEFRLRPGRRFHDGSAVDADAVKFSLDRVLRIGRTAASFLHWLEATEVIDPHRLRLRLAAPYAPALQTLAHPAASIVNPRLVRAHSGENDGTVWLAENSAGSGAYVIEGIVPGETVRLVANVNAARAPTYFTRVHYRGIPDEGVRRLMLERGDVDVIETNLVPAALVDRYRALPGVRVETLPGGPMWSFLVMNNARGALRDARVRGALACAIDYEALRLLILKGNASQIAGYLPAGTPGSTPGEPPPERDLPCARRLLAEAGYPGGVSLVMLTGQVGPVSEFLQANLNEAGIRLQLERRSSGALQALRSSGEFDLLYDAWSMDAPDPALMLESLLASRNIGAAGTNASRYSSIEADRLIDAALAETRAGSRADLLRQLDRRLRADRPIIMLFSANPVIAHGSDVAGLRINPHFPQFLSLATMSRTIGARE